MPLVTDPSAVAALTVYDASYLELATATKLAIGDIGSCVDSRCPSDGHHALEAGRLKHRGCVARPEFLPIDIPESWI